MSSRNDVTGDSLTSKAATAKYRENYDAIFRKKSDDQVEAPAAEAGEVRDEESHQRFAQQINSLLHPTVGR